MLWVCVGGPAQLIVVSAVWSWLPSFLNRVHGMAPEQAGVKAALVVLCGAVGSVVWGAVVDRAGRARPRAKLQVMALLCLLSMLVLGSPSAPATRPRARRRAQFALIALGGFLMTCTVGPVAGVVIDVIHPGMRATGASVLALFQNLFGLAAGPFIAGVLSDLWALETALTGDARLRLIAVGACCVVAAQLCGRHLRAGRRPRRHRRRRALPAASRPEPRRRAPI